MADDSKTPQIPNRVETHRKRWQSLHRSWWFSHYLIGSTSIAAGALAAAESIEPKWLWGVIAATAASFVTFLGPMQKALKYHRAYHVTDQACLEFEVGKIDAGSLVDEVERARFISLGEDKKVSGE
jgi:hypothetical protein